MESLRKIQNFSNIIFKIFYYSDILSNLHYKNHEIDKTLHNNDNDYLQKCKYVDVYLNIFIDIIKKYIITLFYDLNKIKIYHSFFDCKNKYHNFIFDVRKIILKDKKILNDKIDINNTLILLIFDENDKLFFVGMLDFEFSIIKNRINDYLRLNKKRKDNHSRIINLTKVFFDYSAYEKFIDFNKIDDYYYDKQNNNENDISLINLTEQSTMKDDNNDNINIENNEFCFPFEKYLSTVRYGLRESTKVDSVTYQNHIQKKTKKDIKNKESYDNYIKFHKKYN